MILQKQAHLEASSRLESLVRLLGVQHIEDVKIPDTLPPLPEISDTLVDIEQLALEQRIDVQQAKQNVENTARALKLTKTTRFINVLDMGFQYNQLDNAPNETGVEVSLELPLFDFGETHTAKAEAIYQKALSHVAKTAIQARSEARVAYLHYQSSWELARYYRDEVIPLQQKMSDETLLRYNGMLISTFELLAQAHEQVTNMEAALNALREFWLADAQLNRVIQ